jgi:WD40 repeat protein
MAERELALCCLQQFCVSYSGIVGQSRWSPSLAGQLEYAFRFWSSHLERVDGITSGLIIGGSRGILDDAQGLASTVSLGGRFGPLALSYSSDRSQPTVSFGTQHHYRDFMINYRTLDGSKSDVRRIAFSPNGKQLVSGSAKGSLVLLDLQTGSQLGDFMGRTGDVLAVAFSAAGDRLASGSFDETVCLWNPETLQRTDVLRGHTDPVASVAFSPDGTIVVSGSESHTMRVWNTQSRSLIGLLKEHEGAIRSIVFTPDGSHFISGSEDGTLRFWDTSTHQPIGGAIRTPLDRLSCIAISSVGRRIIAGGVHGVYAYTWDDQTFILEDLTFPTVHHVKDIAFSPNDDLIFLCHGDHLRLISYDIKTNQLTPLWGHTQQAITTPQFTISPDGSQIAFGWMNTVRILGTPPPQILSTRFSADGALVLSTLTNKEILLWDLRLAPCISARLNGHDDNLGHIAISPDNNLVAGVTENGMYLWDVPTCRLTASSTIRVLMPIILLSFAADDQSLVTIHDDQKQYNWDEFSENLIPRSSDPACAALASPSRTSHR